MGVFNPSLKSTLKCPCTKDCPNRCAEPNCHSERCPHGYLQWREETDRNKELREKARKLLNNADGYEVDKTRAIKKRRGL